MLPEYTNYVAARPVSTLINNTAVLSRRGLLGGHCGADAAWADEGRVWGMLTGKPAAPRSLQMSLRRAQGARPMVGRMPIACWHGSCAMCQGTG